MIFFIIWIAEVVCAVFAYKGVIHDPWYIQVPVGFCVVITCIQTIVAGLPLVLKEIKNEKTKET
jgi:hypothetical protein